MRRIRALACVVVLCSALVAQAQSTQPLLNTANLVYSGAFRLPASGVYPKTFEYGGAGLVYVPSTNSLMLVGHVAYGLVADVSIPAPSLSTNLGSLPRASLRQSYADVLDGKRWTVDGDKSNGANLGGLLPNSPYLLVSVFDFYDGTQNQTLTHFRSMLDFTKAPGSVVGPVVVGNGQGGFVSGYMTQIPTEWQAVFGGQALSGNCCLSIIQRTSYGPSVAVFNPSDVGVTAPVPATRVLGYTQAHATIGGYSPPGDLFNGATKMGGVAFPSGTRSVLFFGRQPTKRTNYCYGQGTSDPALHGTPNGTQGEIWCWDPTDSDKGTHGYPYTYFVWAYDANDLLAVKNGTKQFWEPVPYATWGFTLPFQVDWGYAGSRRIKGVAYDPGTQRIFLSTEGQDGCCAPLIHVFTVTANLPPGLPTNLRIL